MGLLKLATDHFTHDFNLGPLTQATWFRGSVFAHILNRESKGQGFKGIGHSDREIPRCPMPHGVGPGGKREVWTSPEPKRPNKGGTMDPEGVAKGSVVVLQWTKDGDRDTTASDNRGASTTARIRNK